MTTADATRLAIPRWMALAAPDDVAQIVALVDAMRLPTEALRRRQLRHELRVWRHEVWDRVVTRRPRADAALRPSKRATSGYRTDSERHRAARMTLTSEQRRACAAGRISA